MDMEEKITRTKQEKPKKEESKVIFTLDCSVEEFPIKGDQENYRFKGKIKADKMDPDLMATILAKIIKESVPKAAIEEVLNLTAEKLGFTDACDCECDSCKPKAIHIEKQTVNKDNMDSFISFLKHILGE